MIGTDVSLAAEHFARRLSRQLANKDKKGFADCLRARVTRLWFARLVRSLFARHDTPDQKCARAKH